MIRKETLLVIVILFLFETSLFAQKKYTFTQFGNETVEFIKQPMKWEGIDYLRIGLVGVGTGLTMFADEPIRDKVLKDRSYYYSFPIEFGRNYGELYSPFVFFGGFAAYSLIADDIASRRIAYEIGQASLYAGGLTFLLKVAVGRARPYMEEGAASYHPFSSIINQDNHSIPGGHSTAAFVISTVLSRHVDPVWLKALLYTPAVLTIVSRVYQDQHWTSDNVMGAALGYFVATWVVDKHDEVDKSLAKDLQHGLMEHVQLQPVFTGDFCGLNLKYDLPNIN